jgi:hypothetical protein
MRVSVSLVDVQGRPLPGGVPVTVWTRNSQISETTNNAGFIDHMGGGELMALDVNGVRVVDRVPTWFLGELFGPNMGWGISVKVVVKDPAALGMSSVGDR